MTQPKPRNNFTYQDYKTAPEDKRYELLEGELLLVPAPTTHHQMISRRLFMGLEIFVTSQGLGEIFYSPCDVVLSNYDVVQPDLLFVSNARSHIITPDNIQGGPDLLVGILSPSTADRDLGYKRDLYAQYGVGEYWIVDPEARTVEVLMLGRDGFVQGGLYGHDQGIESPSLVGLAIQLREVF